MFLLPGAGKYKLLYEYRLTQLSLRDDPPQVSFYEFFSVTIYLAETSIKN